MAFETNTNHREYTVAGNRKRTSKQRKPADRKVSRRTVLKGGGAAIAAGVGHLVPGPVSDLLGSATLAAASTEFGGYLPQLRRYPYLTDVVGSYAAINWATDRSQSKASVIWGQQAGDGTYVLNQVTAATRVSITVNSVPVYQWKVELTGLAPDTVYRYRVILGTNPGIDLLGTDVTPAFRSQIAPGDGQPFTFAVFGDWASVYEADGTHPAQANLMAQVLAANPRFAVTTGDNGNHSGSQNNYGDLYTVGAQISGTFGPDFWARPGASIPVFPTIGNHGFGSSAAHHPHLLNWPQSRAVSMSGGRYARALYCCLNDTNPVEYPQTWYAFTAGNVRFYLLQTVWQDSNSGTADAYTNDYAYHWTQESEQYNWVKNDLEQHPHLLKLAFFHYPLYSDGKPIADEHLRGAHSLEGLLASHGVAIAFNGHTHLYQRNHKPHDQGLVSYVTGGGGAKLGPISASGCGVNTAYALGWSYSSNNGAGRGSSCGGAPRPISPDEVHHFLLVSVNGRSVTVTPINSLGQTFDVVTYDFSDISPVDIEPPTVPANLVAAVQGPYSVELTWEASTDNTGVAGYRIFRDEQELASVAGDTLLYLDDTTAPETTYSYTVCAFDAAGNESEPGNAAVAETPEDDQPPPPPAILFTDGFETGDMAMWAPSNGFTVQGQFTSSGFYAAVANVTNAAAVAYRQLDQPCPELYQRIRFFVSAYDNKTTYLQQFRTAQGGSLLGLYISGSGRLGYRNIVAGRNVNTTIAISKDQWHEAQIRVRINGTTSETEVWYDGNRIDQLSLTESLGSVDIGRVQLGESAARTHVIVYDDVVVSTGFIDPAVETDPPPYILDTLPPSPPTDPVANANGVTGIDLSWSASFDNVSVTAYRIYRDAAVVAEVPGTVTTWFDAGVLPDIAYTYTLDAQDAAGNVSDLSVPVVVTMFSEEPPPDEPPPDEPPLVTIFNDGFETGDMSLWTSSTGFDVDQANAYSGVYSAHLAITNSAGVAYRQLDQAYEELFHRIFMYMNVYDPKTTYLQQFRTLNGASLVGLYISASGRLGYRNIVSGVNVNSTIAITPGVWHEVQFRVRIAGAESQTEVWYDGARVPSLSKTEPLGSDGIGRIQLGESAARTLDIAYDDITVSTVFVEG